MVASRSMFRILFVFAIAVAVVGAMAACDLIGGEPSTEQPEVNLESLAMSASTTGQDVLDHVSEAEADCLNLALGNDDYNAFLEAELLTMYGQVGDLDPLYACLTGDNFVLFGIDFAAARGGLAETSRDCLIGLGRDHPDAVVTILGIETPPAAVTELTSMEHAYTLELFDCLNAEEKVGLTVHLWAEVGAYQFTGEQLVAGFNEQEITCFMDSFGITREQLVALMGSRLPGQTSSEAVPCFTEETLGRLSTHMLSIQLGGLTDETNSCILAFSLDHPHFFELLRVGAFDSSVMSQEEFIEIVNDGQQVLHCLNDDELRLMQRSAAVGIASFGTES